MMKDMQMDPKAQALFDRMVALLCRHDLRDSHVAQAQELAEQLYELGWQDGQEAFEMGPL